LPKHYKVLSHLGYKSKVLPGPLNDFCLCVGFCTSSPQQGVKYQLWFLDFFLWGEPINILWKIANGRQSSFSLGVKIKSIARIFNWLKCLVGFCNSSPQQGVFLFVGGPYKYPNKLANGRQTSFPLGIEIKGIFNWLKCLGWILHLKPTTGCQISTLIFGYFLGRPINIPWQIANGQQSSFSLLD
jgi:hypothetical protein